MTGSFTGVAAHTNKKPWKKATSEWVWDFDKYCIENGFRHMHGVMCLQVVSTYRFQEPILKGDFVLGNGKREIKIIIEDISKKTYNVQ